MRLYIPTVGTELTLAKDWTFVLFDEYRNHTLFEHLGLPVAAHYRDPRMDTTVVMPAGTKIIVDRIYIRKGASDFDSVSFRMVGAKTKTKHTPRTWHQVSGSNVIKSGTYTYTHPARQVRFWAKLEDVNNIEFV